MGQARCNRRRRKQASQGFNHLARICGGSVVGGRPKYRVRRLKTLSEQIAIERQKASAERRRAVKRKS